LQLPLFPFSGGVGLAQTIAGGDDVGCTGAADVVCTGADVDVVGGGPCL